MAVTKPRNRVVLFRLTEDEYEAVQAACSENSARSLSDFARARILGPAPAAQTAPDRSSLRDVETRLTDLQRAVDHLTEMLSAPDSPANGHDTGHDASQDAAGGAHA